MALIDQDSKEYEDVLNSFKQLCMKDKPKSALRAKASGSTSNTKRVRFDLSSASPGAHRVKVKKPTFKRTKAEILKKAVKSKEDVAELDEAAKKTHINNFDRLYSQRRKLSRAEFLAIALRIFDEAGKAGKDA